MLHLVALFVARLRLARDRSIPYSKTIQIEKGPPCLRHGVAFPMGS